MTSYTYPFEFILSRNEGKSGCLNLHDVVSFTYSSSSSYKYRKGVVELSGGHSIELVIHQNNATSSFVYLHNFSPNQHFSELIGAELNVIEHLSHIPGQLVFGIERTRLIGEAISKIFSSPPLIEVVQEFHPDQIITVPILREGNKYQVTEALFDNHRFYATEIVADAHHVADSTVAHFQRTVEFSIFKDSDLTDDQREQVKIAFVSDSIASGIVMIGVLRKLKDRFPNIERVEIIAPFSALVGLARLAHYSDDLPEFRVHAFETLLNAQPPDYFYSSHFPIEHFHISPELEMAYRSWWGQDSNGNHIANTACAGFGWSEVFYVPRKHIEMMNEQLNHRHNVNIADLLVRNALTS